MKGEYMQKAVENFLFGLTFGMGFAIANNVLNIIAALLHGH
jgi:RsiW-degrading membrane proteinase PrsW (M82 family)